MEYFLFNDFRKVLNKMSIKHKNMYLLITKKFRSATTIRSHVSALNARSLRAVAESSWLSIRIVTIAENATLLLERRNKLFDFLVII